MVIWTEPEKQEISFCNHFFILISFILLCQHYRTSHSYFIIHKLLLFFLDNPLSPSSACTLSIICGRGPWATTCSIIRCLRFNLSNIRKSTIGRMGCIFFCLIVFKSFILSYSLQWCPREWRERGDVIETKQSFGKGIVYE